MSNNGIHFCSMKGRRDNNEDAHSIASNISGLVSDKAPINFYGLYDGHGGSDVSNYLKQTMKMVLMRPEIKYPIKENNKKLIDSLYNVVEEVLIEKHSDDAREVGSTCLIACHSRLDGIDYLNVFNTGDSRLVVCDKNFIAQSLTVDHKPDSPAEKFRILKMGANPERDLWSDGGVIRIGDLSVSRAFGDTKNKYVVCTPEIYTKKITDNYNFMIMGCDGLWDVMSNQDAVDFVVERCYDENFNKKSDKDIINIYSTEEDETFGIAQQLGKHAIDIGSTDNITIIIVFFD